MGLHMRQQVDPRKLELSIARTAFGISPLRLLDGRALDNGMAALKKSLQHATQELQQLDGVARHIPGKSMLCERRGCVLREVRELELELRHYQLEKIRRRELGMATVGMRLQNERWRMSHGRRLRQPPDNTISDAEVLVTKEVPKFIQLKLPVLSPSRGGQVNSTAVDTEAGH